MMENGEGEELYLVGMHWRWLVESVFKNRMYTKNILYMNRGTLRMDCKRMVARILKKAGCIV